MPDDAKSQYRASLRWFAAIAALWLNAGVAAAPPVAVPDTMAQRVLACTVCHGRDGRATPQGYFPRIAGKPGGYLFNQLRHFREGRRPNATMAYLLAPLTDAYLQDIAAYFSALDLPYAAAPPADAAPAELEHGAALVRQGDPARDIPACSACHGERLTGETPAVPGLLGVPRDYIAAQLGAWQTGQRKAAGPDCMAQVAARLNSHDVAALASWLAAQPLPADTHPTAPQGGARPLPCGSVAP